MKETPSQTAGPYVHIGLTPNLSGVGGVYDADLGAEMTTGPVRGEEIVLHGVIRDGMGAIIKDAVVEVWQADADGLFGADGDPNFTGWGRCACDMETGEYRFETVKPGPVPYPDGRMQAPHVTVWIVARGINLGLQTRAYFEDEENGEDPVLKRIEHRDRVETLIARREADGVYRFDIVLQGDGETVFFDV
ncbi:protocatechuate 3,4-dioxygenase subunit alpha [Aestuariibius sp. 2305UL40-4]|uniref:protocatechuate 3,4-dioxygenase subunit alpha n=1 Tax=Aestuariibius violaceus TaxID=3234132 RepID=UPI00345EBC3E